MTLDSDATVAVCWGDLGSDLLLPILLGKGQMRIYVGIHRRSIDLEGPHGNMGTWAHEPRPVAPPGLLDGALCPRSTGLGSLCGPP